MPGQAERPPHTLRRCGTASLTVLGGSLNAPVPAVPEQTPHARDGMQVAPAAPRRRAAAAAAAALDSDGSAGSGSSEGEDDEDQPLPGEVDEDSDDGEAGGADAPLGDESGSEGGALEDEEESDEGEGAGGGAGEGGLSRHAAELAGRAGRGVGRSGRAAPDVAGAGRLGSRDSGISPAACGHAREASGLGSVGDEEEDDEEEEGEGAAGEDGPAADRRKSGAAAGPSGQRGDGGSAGRGAGGRGKAAGFFAETPEGTRFSAGSFADLHLSRPLLKAVAELGYAHPTPIQVGGAASYRGCWGWAPRVWVSQCMGGVP